MPTINALIKFVLILVQSDAFNADIQLTETNYDVLFQLMEMHILIEKNSPILWANPLDLLSLISDMKNDMLKIER